MQATPQHTYQILTKRPDRMADSTASLPVLPIVARDKRRERRLSWAHQRLAQGRCYRQVCFVRAFTRVRGSGRSDGYPVGNRRRRKRPTFATNGRARVAEIETACLKARTAFFFKQWGGVRKKNSAGTIADARSMRCRAPSRCPKGSRRMLRSFRCGRIEGVYPVLL